MHPENASSNPPIDAPAELAELRRRRSITRRRPYRTSRLERFRAELVALRRAGGSYAELADWLRQRRVKVARTTVLRYLAKLPELAPARGVEHA
ncbi:MAG: hypothetical protein PVJ30_00990 [Thiohalocapsa sp.]|jgi:hypothetical protein